VRSRLLQSLPVPGEAQNVLQTAVKYSLNSSKCPSIPIADFNDNRNNRLVKTCRLDSNGQTNTCATETKLKEKTRGLSPPSKPWQLQCCIADFKRNIRAWITALTRAGSPCGKCGIAQARLMRSEPVISRRIGCLASDIYTMSFETPGVMPHSHI